MFYSPSAYYLKAVDIITDFLWSYLAYRGFVTLVPLIIDLLLHMTAVLGPKRTLSLPLLKAWLVASSAACERIGGAPCTLNFK